MNNYINILCTFFCSDQSSFWLDTQLTKLQSMFFTDRSQPRSRHVPFRIPNFRIELWERNYQVINVSSNMICWIVSNPLVMRFVCPLKQVVLNPNISDMSNDRSTDLANPVTFSRATDHAAPLALPLWGWRNAAGWVTHDLLHNP